MTLENVLLEPNLDTVKGILILDNDGKRILAKWDVRSYDSHIHIKIVQVLWFWILPHYCSSEEIWKESLHENPQGVLVFVADFLNKVSKPFVADLRYDFHHQANAEIIMLDGFTCLYKSSVDLFFYVVMWLCVQIGWHWGSANEKGISFYLLTYFF